MTLKKVLLTFYFMFLGYCTMAQNNLSNPPSLVDSIYFDLKRGIKKNSVLGRNDLLAKNHFQLGQFYSGHGIYSEAVSQFNIALQLLEGQPVDTIHVWLNNAIGKVDFERKNYEMAQEYFEEASRLSQKINYARGQAISSGLLGASFEKLGKYDEALENQLKALQLFEGLKDKIWVSVVNENIGSIYEDLEDFELAKSYFLKTYDSVERSGTPLEANVLNNLGDVYRKTGNYHEALSYTNKALEVAKGNNDLNQFESSHKDLSKTYNLIGNYKEAYKHLLIADTYNSQLVEMQNADQLNVLLAIYENRKKENQITLLQEQTKVSRANQNLLWLALIASIIIGVLIYFYRNRRRQAELKLKEFEQRALRAELEKKIEEEKNLQQEIQLKASALSRYSIHLSQKNKILHDLSLTLKNMASRRHMDVEGKLKKIANEINFNLQQEGEWDEFMSFFKEIHPNFIKRLSSLSDENLSSSELRLGMLLRLNMSSKEIASVLRVTPDSVRVARHRLRKKLPIDSKEELVNFMVEL